MNKKRGQVSVEYLVVAGFVVFLIISVLGISYFYTSSISDNIRYSQLSSFANNVIGSAESVYYSGEPSRVKISAYLPPGITGIEVYTKDIVFNVTTSSGEARIDFSSNVPIEGSLNPSSGTKTIVISAIESGVMISEG